MQSTVTLKASGLYSQPNQLTVPEGSLTQASNVIIQRDSVVEPRRGFGLFGNAFGTLTDRLKQLFVYQFRLLRHWGSTLEFDTGSLNNAGNEQFQAFPQPVVEAQAGLRIKSSESNGNLYFTSSKGIQKISVLSNKDLSNAQITQAGGVKALDVTATLDLVQGNITGFLPQDSTVAYRILWGIIDANKNLILGVPSQRAEVFFPLEDALILDFDNTLEAIQNTANQPSPNNSLIDDSDYVSSLVLPDNATAGQIRSNLLSLSSKLDNDILIANDGGTAQLTISAVSIVNNTSSADSNVCTVTFSAGNPTNYWIAGSNIFLTGFPVGENQGSINGLQSITSVTSTTITFLTSVTGNSQVFTSTAVSTPNDNITIPNHGFKNYDPVRFTNVGGALPSPLVTGTTYYVGNVIGNTFQIYSDATLTTLVNLTTPGSGTSTITYFMSVTSTSINSGEFRSLVEPVNQDTPATDQELVSLQTYLQQVINKLKEFLSTGTIPIISSYSQTNYIQPLSLTTTANVNVEFTIPQNLGSQYFYQIYRSPVTQATGIVSLSDLTASDELQQVFEAFPTAAQLAAGTITVTDIVPDQFLGTNLYTNEASGVGIANANETPPFALDINKFKNVTFYANTRTKFRMSLNLLGISKMISDFQGGNTPQLTIATDTSTNIYSFVEGVQQITHVQTVADSTNSLNGKYFLINSANNETMYYFWYKTSGGTTSDPGVANATGIEVFINTNDSANTVAAKTRDAINTLTEIDFSASASTNVITITNNKSGYTNNASNGTSGFTFTTPTSGVGQKLGRITGNFSTVADVSGNLAGKYFTITTPYNKIKYYIWYIVSGSGTDPLVPNAVGVPINITINDSANTVAAKTAAQLNAFGINVFVASNPSSNTLIVSPFNYGPGNLPTAGTSGFTLNSTTNGFLQVLLSNLVSPALAVNETAKSLVQVINQNPSEILYAFYLSQSSTVPGQMTLESRDLTTSKYFLVTNNANTGSEFSPNLSPEISISSIVAGSGNSSTVTTSTPHGLQTGDQVIITATDSTPIADGLYTITFLTPTTFSINLITISSATKGQMISAIDAFGGDNEKKINRIYFSQILQPEAVPLGNTIDVGDTDKAILRIFPLRDSLFVFKEDGLFRISGETTPFTLSILDLSCILIAPDSLAVAKNVIYSWTTQGILLVTEAGVSNPPISRPIDNLILPIGSNNYPNFSTATWGVGYESDNSYIVFTVKETTDTKATIAYRYSTLTGTWTTWDKTDTCGIVNPTDDKLYLGAGDTNFLEQERKSFTRYDYADRELATSLDTGNYFGNVIKVSDASKFAAGDILSQSQNLTVYEFNALLQKLDNDTKLNSNSITNITTGSTPIITTSGNHFLSTGDFVNISNTLTTPLINGIFQITKLSNTTFQISVSSPIITGGTSGLVKYDYFSSLALIGGDNLQTGLNNLATRFNSEPNLIYKTDTVSITSNSVANPTILLLSSASTLGPAGTIRRIRVSSNVGSSPSINGDWDATVIDSTHVSIPVNVTIGGTGGSLTTLDDYFTAIQPVSGSITAISASNPTIITAPNHGMVSNRYLQISGSNSSPSIDGNYSITLIDANHFSIPINVLVAGTTASFATLTGTFQDVLTNYNYIIQILNKDTGTNFKNYNPITTVTNLETIITSVNYRSNTLTLDLTLDFVIGPMNVFKAINSLITYSPVTFQDTLNLKQVSEATMMFENKAFSQASLNFASDLLPEFSNIPFSGNGSGSFGLGSGQFGANFFGGAANAAPFRTYIPRNAQRCRYIIAQFNHKVALEKFGINGLTLSGNITQSTRAYR